MQQGSCVVGIDPGLKGAIVQISGQEVRGWKMPTCPRVRENESGGGRQVDTLALLDLLRGLEGRAIIWVEHPFSIPNSSILATQTTFENFGRLTGALESLNLAYGLVRPQIWQSEVSSRLGQPKQKGLEPKKQAKLWFEEVLRRNFPHGLSPHGPPSDGFIDAFLIAWSRRG